ncbi:unnamed protein product [Nyctereutes procyonoides]|uniref:(raccoon dog) hypothetical protein n=1 Tax=Nyctereutes procyonoides TaxID=34880 RepID=A0A811YJG4_NYCPR|nr:unnamed protein product [Nyctereutes procyonoides]
MPGAGPGCPDSGATWRPGRAAWPRGGLAPGPGLGRAGSPASSGQPLSGQPRLLPPPSPASPCPVVGLGVRPTRLCHVCHPPGTQEHLSKIPGGRGRAAAAASGPPSPGSQCQMRAGDKSSIFLVLLGWQQSLPQHHLAPGSPASGGRDWGTDGRGWPGRAGRLRARRRGAGTWGRPAGRRDPPPPAVPGLARGHRGHVLALLTPVLASDLYLLAAPRTRHWAGRSQRVGRAEQPPPWEPEPATPLRRQSRAQTSRSSGTEAGLHIGSVLFPGRVDGRQVISALQAPSFPTCKMGAVSVLPGLVETHGMHLACPPGLHRVPRTRWEALVHR